MNYVELGKRIREARHGCGLTQAALAEKADVSTSFIGHIERGSRVVSLDTFVKICTALKVSPNALLDVAAYPRLSMEESVQLERLLLYACHLVRAKIE